MFSILFYINYVNLSPDFTLLCFPEKRAVHVFVVMGLELIGGAQMKLLLLCNLRPIHTSDIPHCDRERRGVFCGHGHL